MNIKLAAHYTPLWSFALKKKYFDQSYTPKKKSQLVPFGSGERGMKGKETSSQALTSDENKNAW